MADSESGEERRLTAAKELVGLFISFVEEMSDRHTLTPRFKQVLADLDHANVVVDTAIKGIDPAFGSVGRFHDASPDLRRRIEDYYATYSDLVSEDITFQKLFTKISTASGLALQSARVTNPAQATIGTEVPDGPEPDQPTTASPQSQAEGFGEVFSALGKYVPILNTILLPVAAYTLRAEPIVAWGLLGAAALSSIKGIQTIVTSEIFQKLKEWIQTRNRHAGTQTPGQKKSISKTIRFASSVLLALAVQAPLRLFGLSSIPTLLICIPVCHLIDLKWDVSGRIASLISTRLGSSFQKQFFSSPHGSIGRTSGIARSWYEAARPERAARQSPTASSRTATASNRRRSLFPRRLGSQPLGGSSTTNSDPSTVVTNITEGQQATNQHKR